MTEEEMKEKIEELEFERTKDREKMSVLNAELLKLRSEFEAKRLEIQTLWHNIHALWANKKGS